jgi:hypothetical protein
MRRESRWKALPTRFPASGSVALFRGRKFGGRPRNLPYRRHHQIRGGLLDQVAVSGDRMKRTLGNVGVQPGRLGIDIDQLVLLV